MFMPRLYGAACGLSKEGLGSNKLVVLRSACRWAGLRAAVTVPADEGEMDKTRDSHEWPVDKPLI